MWCKDSSILISSIVIAISGSFCLAACPSADLTGDCFVDFNDFALIAIDWPTTDFDDVAVMANQWLTGDPCDPCIPDGMVWVYIDDPGVSGHEGFTGYMSKYETTNAQSCEYLNSAMNDGLITVYNDRVYAVSDTSHSQAYFYIPATNSYSQITYSDGTFSVRSRDGYSMANHPVVEVSWYGATAFCNYYGYRLPTEWEWQAVADYDGSYTYGCGTTIDQSKANYRDGDFANPLNLSSHPYTSPVDYYETNGRPGPYGYGMCDMAGNVWEWTSTVSGSGRGVRGGGWSYSFNNCTVSNQLSRDPYRFNATMGFRVCR